MMGATRKYSTAAPTLRLLLSPQAMSFSTWPHSQQIVTLLLNTRISSAFGNSLTSSPRRADRMRLACRTAALLSILVFAQGPSLATNSSSTGAPTDANWTAMNANRNGTNHAEQSQVGPDNVNQLTKRWVFSIPPASPVKGLDLLQNGSISPPLSVNGTVYIVNSYLRS